MFGVFLNLNEINYIKKDKFFLVDVMFKRIGWFVNYILYYLMKFFYLFFK